MGFRQGAYARIWNVNDMGNYSFANVTVSRKDKETGEYKVEFSDGYVRLVGNAHTAAKELGLPDREHFNSKVDRGVSIQITSCDVTNNYSAKDKKVYTNCVIFGFEIPDDNNDTGKQKADSKQAKKPKKKDAAPPPETEYNDTDDDDDDLPF